MPREGEGQGSGRGDAPRTDLPPRKEPYDDGYFGSEEEEGVVREEELPDAPETEEPDAA
jgi:hypothetical protein